MNTKNPFGHVSDSCGPYNCDCLAGLFSLFIYFLKVSDPFFKVLGETVSIALSFRVLSLVWNHPSLPVLRTHFFFTQRQQWRNSGKRPFVNQTKGHPITLCLLSHVAFFPLQGLCLGGEDRKILSPNYHLEIESWQLDSRSCWFEMFHCLSKRLLQSEQIILGDLSRQRIVGMCQLLKFLGVSRHFRVSFPMCVVP